MVLSCLSPVACGGSTNSEGPASGGGASSGGGGTTAAGGAGGSARWDAGEDGDGAGTAADAASDAGGDAPLDSPSDGPPDVSTDSPWCICPSTIPGDGEPCNCKSQCLYHDCVKAEYQGASCWGGVWHQAITWDVPCVDAG